MNNLKFKRGFSFVEIIIALSLIILLTIIGFNINTSYQEKTNNSKIQADLDTLNNSLLSYQTSKKLLPMPGGNNNFYDSGASYSHSWEDTKTFGVNGFITENTLPKEFINYLPIDPKTNQYYAYGKTKSKLSFQVAGIKRDNGVPKSYVIGNYSGEEGLYDLIREYDGPDFVYNNSTSDFPYNPDERELTARINDFTGTVSINNQSLSATGILDYILREGDNIKTSTGSYAFIYFSDGSKSTLGDETKVSDLTLTNMKYTGENNLITKIKLILGGGTIWNNATKLNPDGSEFEIYTTDSTASVRGTIFGVSKDQTKTNTTVSLGKVEIQKIEITGITIAPTTNNLINALKSNTLNKINLNGGSTTTLIEAIGQESGIDTYHGNNAGNSTGAIQNVDPNILIQEEINNNIETKIESLTGTTGTDKEINLEINNKIKKAKYLKINGAIRPNFWQNENIIKIPQSMFGSNTKIKLSFCNTKKNGKEVCTREKEIDLTAPNYTSESIEDVYNQNLAVKTPPSNSITENFAGKTVENSLWKFRTQLGSDFSSYKLYGVADYNDKGNIDLKKRNGTSFTLTQNYIISPNNTVSLPSVCSNTDKSKSFCDLGNGNGGVLIEPVSNTDFIKYSGLNLSGNYVLDINARLNYADINTSNGAYLFSGESGKINIKLSEAGLFVNNTLVENFGNIKSSLNFNTGDNKFYRFLVFIDDNKINRIEIFDETGVIKYKNPTDLGKPTNSTNDFLFVGGIKIGVSSYYNQINNIIDEVKIYTKN